MTYIHIWCALLYFLRFMPHRYPCFVLVTYHPTSDMHALQLLTSKISFLTSDILSHLWYASALLLTFHYTPERHIEYFWQLCSLFNTNAQYCSRSILYLIWMTGTSDVLFHVLIHTHSPPDISEHMRRACPALLIFFSNLICTRRYWHHIACVIRMISSSDVLFDAW